MKIAHQTKKSHPFLCVVLLPSLTRRLLRLPQDQHPSLRQVLEGLLLVVSQQRLQGRRRTPLRRAFHRGGAGAGGEGEVGYKSFGKRELKLDFHCLFCLLLQNRFFGGLSMAFMSFHYAFFSFIWFKFKKNRQDMHAVLHIVLQ